MNEPLFNEAAQVRADQRRQRAAQGVSSQPESPVEVGPATRHAVAFAAAVLVNLAVLGTLQWTAANARYAPAGEVVITQLEATTSLQLANN
jgi:hypothetical protein